MARFAGVETDFRPICDLQRENDGLKRQIVQTQAQTYIETEVYQRVCAGQSVAEADAAMSTIEREATLLFFRTSIADTMA